MKKFSALVAGLLCITYVSQAQDDLFGSEQIEKKKGFVVSAGGGVDLPMADMADRFGVSFRIGPSVFYKTASNWILGAKWDFIFGNDIKEPGLLSNIKSPDGSIISADGFRTNVNLLERGYLIGLQAGKIFSLDKKNPNIGILALTTVGFMQHKIYVPNSDNNIPQLNKDYKKGYDRLTNGLFIEEFVGYNHFSNNGLINFSIGINVLAGFTQGRRDYFFDTMKPGNEKRFDMLTGIKLNWYVPIFKGKSEEVFFE